MVIQLIFILPYRLIESTGSINYTACNTATKSGNGNYAAYSSANDPNHLGQPVPAYCTAWGTTNNWSENTQLASNSNLFGSRYHYPAISTSKSFPTGGINYKACNIGSYGIETNNQWGPSGLAWNVDNNGNYTCIPGYCTDY